MTYTLRQQAFTLSMMSNSDASTEKGTVDQLEAALSKKINGYLTDSALIKLIGNWEVVWGPAVWQNQGSDVADNAMFVGYNSQQNVYVVAVAGTNPSSLYDVEVEDLEVSPMVPWTYGGTANIATGTAAGLTVLLNLQSGGQTLSQYLGSAPSSSTATLIFAGHSLGGALAPALATALFNQTGGELKSAWPIQNVFVAPTAGPTPGDQGFVNLYSSTFPASNGSSQGLNTLVWNSLDVVPHAWAATTFSAQTLDNIYAPNGLAASSCIQTVVGDVAALPPSPNLYVQLPSSGAFAGTFQKPLIPFEDDTCAYLAQVLYQHIRAYFEQIAPELISGFNPIFKPINPYSVEGRLVVSYLCKKVESYACNTDTGEVKKVAAAGAQR